MIRYPTGSRDVPRPPRRRSRKINRPTETEAIRQAMRYEKLMRSAQWRIAKFGFVRLTIREEQAIRLEREAMQRRYHLDNKVQSFIAVRMNCSQQNVSSTLRRASMILELLENYPRLGCVSPEFWYNQESLLA